MMNSVERLIAPQHAFFPRTKNDEKATTNEAKSPGITRLQVRISF